MILLQQVITNEIPYSSIIDLYNRYWACINPISSLFIQNDGCGVRFDFRPSTVLFLRNWPNYEHAPTLVPFK